MTVNCIFISDVFTTFHRSSSFDYFDAEYVSYQSGASLISLAFAKTLKSN